MTPLKHFQSRKRNGMTIYSEILLDLISTMDESNVMRVINLAISIEIATQSTLHKSLMWLKNHNFINIIRSEKDSRDKIVLITRKGKNYLGGL